MINFLKEYSYSIFKMFVNQLGIMIFGLVLSLATAKFSTLFIAAAIFGSLFYMLLLYTMTWDIGYEEKIRIEGKRMKYVPLKGLYMSLVANIPNIALAVLAIVGYYGGGAAKSGPVWPQNLYGAPNLIARFIQPTYVGIIDPIFNKNPWGLLVIVIPSLITCTLAYIAGVKAFRILPFGGPKESKD